MALLIFLAWLAIGAGWTFGFAYPKYRKATASLDLKWFTKLGTILGNLLAWPIQMIRWGFFDYLKTVF